MATTATVARRIIFSAWANASPKHEFDCGAAVEKLVPLEGKDTVLEQNEALTAAVVLRGPSADDPALIQLLALRDYDNRPIDWGPGSFPAPITIGEDRYTADVTHVAIWQDKIIAHDVYTNAPGLSRLSAYLRDKADQRVIFRPLYDPNLKTQLEDIEGFRRFEYGIHTPSKVQHARNAGFLSDLFPGAFGEKVPSVRVELGMSRQSPRDAYLDEELSDAMLRALENAEQFFDTVAISGRSKTQKTPAGNPKTVRLNLLKHRIQLGMDIARSPNGGNLPDADSVYEALIDARKTIDKNGRLSKAVEARAILDVIDNANGNGAIGGAGG
jgi:hypothetical protein